MNISLFAKVPARSIESRFIFDRCHRSLAVVTPVRYDRDISPVNSVLVTLKNEENEETPGEH